MSQEVNNMEINKEQFQFVNDDRVITDVKLDTKPIGYLHDAWNRFKKNKASVVATVIIAIIALFAIIVPFCTPYKINQADGYYAKVRPRITGAKGAWDGGYSVTQNDNGYILFQSIAMAAMDINGVGPGSWEDSLDNPYSPVLKVKATKMVETKTNNISRTSRFHDLRVDSYMAVGFKIISGLTREEYEDILAWQERTGKQVIYPMIDTSDDTLFPASDLNDVNEANYWYAHTKDYTPLYPNNVNDLSAGFHKMTLEEVQQKGLWPLYRYDYARDENGNVIWPEGGGTPSKDQLMMVEITSSGEGGVYKNYRIRVLYYNYYQYVNGYEPQFIFGADSQGYDILVRLAHGCRLSLLLAVAVSVINLVIGAIYGAIEGYYGGIADMIMERITDVLSGIPFIILMTLFRIHLVDTGKVGIVTGVIFAFVVTGWIGTAYAVRMQFYRFKGQEYILAARTLGARDGRLMFKHIFPNALGTLITSSVLVIPGVIFSETSLAYLGIINFNGTNITSLGAMLANGQTAGIDRYPHIIFFPALILSLLMISFNLFGNGLRDAFNPSLRGTED